MTNINTLGCLVDCELLFSAVVFSVGCQNNVKFKSQFEMCSVFQMLIGKTTSLVHVCLSGTKESIKDVRTWKTTKALNQLPLQEPKQKQTKM